MKTTVELSEALFRRANEEAALRGCKFKDLVEEGLRLLLKMPRHGKLARRSLEALMAPARGMVDSKLPDLATNRKRLKGFGRGARRDR
jgi:hypothetical protein